MRAKERMTSSMKGNREGEERVRASEKGDSEGGRGIDIKSESDG